MKHLLKSVVRKVLSDRTSIRIMSMRSRNYQLKLLRQTDDMELTQKLVDAYGTSVLNGPFRGQIYAKTALLTRLCAPRLLGSYEQELHRIFANLDPSYEAFLDVGAAEGYYVVGMARKSGGGKVFAYETDPRELSSCREIAQLNGVSGQVDFRSWCDENEIVSLCAHRRCFVLSDCEGYELDLFGPRAIDALRRSDLVIELHDHPEVNTREVLWNRFAPTHHLEVLSVELRHIEDYPESKILKERAGQALSDHRPPTQQWLHCLAR